LKKLNHIWIFSDSILGHEIQSLALASKIAQKTSLFHCGLRQPWLSFAPRILPGFGKNIIWENKKPDEINLPDAIVTCGRRMAAIGKYYKKLLQCKHIQILNPKDDPKKYDLIISPEHDQMDCSNVISSKGSLHNISPKQLLPYKIIKQHSIIGLLIGNPGKKFFNNINYLSDQITKAYPAHELIICGSRRTDEKYRTKIIQTFTQAKQCWFDDSDGENPYLSLLANSDIILVTADSINMVSEACATDKTVVALAKDIVSPKHKRFIRSLKVRLSKFGSEHSHPIPLDSLNQVAREVILKLNEH